MKAIAETANKEPVEPLPALELIAESQPLTFPRGSVAAQPHHQSRNRMSFSPHHPGAARVIQRIKQSAEPRRKASSRGSWGATHSPREASTCGACPAALRLLHERR